MPKATTCNSGEAAKALSCRNSSPGAILTRRDDSPFVRAGLLPAIHVFVAPRKEDVDARDRRGHDAFWPTAPDPAPAPASAASPAAGTPPERRRTYRGCPRGRTDKAAVRRSAKTGGCRQK